MLDERSLLSQFVRFSTATVASLMVFSLYSIVDGLFVARGVGEYAMSAVNLSAPFLNLLFSIAVIFAVGTSTILSIFLGQGKRERANSLFSQNVTLLTVTGVVITVLVLLFLEPVAKLLGAEGVTLPYTKDYLTGLAPFAVCFIISYNMEILIKTDGYPQLAIRTVITGCLTNCVLDYVAIFHLDLGVWGAAVATGLSQLLTCVIYLHHFIRGKTTFHFVRFRMDWRIYRRLIPIGISDGVNELCNGLMILLFNHMILHCIGQEGLVSYTIIAYTNTLVINMMMGISQGSQPLVSFHYGKEDAAGCRKLLAVRVHRRGYRHRRGLFGHLPAGAPAGAGVPVQHQFGAEPDLRPRPPAVQPVLPGGGLQHPHRRLPHRGGTAASCHLHLRRPWPGAPGGGADGPGLYGGRQQHLVCAAHLGAALSGAVPEVFAELPQIASITPHPSRFGRRDFLRLVPT